MDGRIRDQAESCQTVLEAEQSVIGSMIMDREADHWQHPRF